MWVLNFQTLTPLHISNGNELGLSFDYIEKNGYVHKFDVVKASQKIVDLNLFDFSNSYSYEEYRTIIEKNKEKLGDDIFEYSIECTSRALKQIRNERAEGRNIIKEFINSNGNFYIPGSSVKGTLATILRRESIGIKNFITQKFVITDSEFINKENFIVDRTYKGRPSVLLISLKPYSNFSLKIRKIGDLSISELRKKIKDYYSIQLERAYKAVSEYVDPTLDETGANIFSEILNIYSQVLSTEFKEDEYLINLGYGSGTYFKIFNDVDIPQNYNRKTRRKEKPHTTFSFFDGEYIDHIGWCKLTIEEE